MTGAAWPLVSLRDLGAWYGGGTPSKSQAEFWTDGHVPWLSPKDMGRDVIRSTQDHITLAAVENSTVRLVPKDSVAIVVRSGILARTLPVSLVPFATTLNQDMKAIVPRDGVLPLWIAYGLRAYEHQLLITARKSGTTVASIDTKKLQSSRLPLPPEDVQRQVIDILEDHLSRLEAAGGLLDRTERRIAVLEESVVVESLGVGTGSGLIVDGELPVLVDGWVWSTLGEVSEVVGGVTKDAKKQANVRFVEVPYLRVANVQRTRLDLDSVTTIRVSPEKALELTLQPGDVLMNEGGDRDKLARGWVWNGEIDGCIHQNHVFRARTGGRVRPEWLAWCANTYGARWAQRHGRQSVNLASISLRTIRMMPIPLPPLDIQDERLDAIREAVGSTGRLRTETETALKRGSVLRRSLLAAAFAGRLTGADSDIDRELEDIENDQKAIAR